MSGRLSFDTLRAEYAGGARVRDLLDVLGKRIDDGDPAIWISRVPDAALAAYAARLDALDTAGRANLPLFGLPFAIKDNIDLAGLPTTAACPAFAYEPKRDAHAVARLIAAGAIPLGKTNLDQFASGLVGTRSPYGTPRNPFDERIVPGGSSSGSALAVAREQVSFALGTDTAGSGRVPAGFTNTVGLKPTRGVISAAGLVPACRSLDCVSIFATNVCDAMDVHAIARGVDANDPLSRPWQPLAECARPFRFAVPRDDQLAPFGSDRDARAYAEGIARLQALGGTRVPIDFTPCHEVGKLLYGGPFVAERYASVASFFETYPEAVWPVMRSILEDAKTWTAAALFTALETVDRQRARARTIFEAADVLFLPTVPGRVTLEDDRVDPRGSSAMLGTYTNFVNFFDWTALAVPSAIGSDGFPIGATLIAPAHGERLLAGIGARYLAEGACVAA